MKRKSEVFRRELGAWSKHDDETKETLIRDAIRTAEEIRDTLPKWVGVPTENRDYYGHIVHETGHEISNLKYYLRDKSRGNYWNALVRLTRYMQHMEFYLEATTSQTN